MSSSTQSKKTLKTTLFLFALLAGATAISFLLLDAFSSSASPREGTGSATPPLLDRLVAGARTRWADGPAEIRSSFDAKKAAKSFRMKTELRLHPGQPLVTTIEVACPDRERFTTVLGDRALHAVRIGASAYTEQKDGSWSKQETPADGWSPCGENPGEPAPWAVMNEGRDPGTVLAKMLDKAEVTRGDFVATSAGNCQQWLVAIKLPGDPVHGHGKNGLRYTVCISPNHLPVSVTMGSGGMVTTYSDWDVPIQIDAPAGLKSRNGAGAFVAGTNASD